jgi:hypothetical protein
MGGRTAAGRAPRCHWRSMASILDSGYDVPGWLGGGKSMKCFGGPGEIRTHDLFHAMEARSQLRHRPTMRSFPLYHTPSWGRLKTRGKKTRGRLPSGLRGSGSV